MEEDANVLLDDPSEVEELHVLDVGIGSSCVVRLSAELYVHSCQLDARRSTQKRRDARFGPSSCEEGNTSVSVPG